MFFFFAFFLFQVPPFFPNKSNNVRGHQSDWDQSDERKQRQQIMMGGKFKNIFIKIYSLADIAQIIWFKS